MASVEIYEVVRGKFNIGTVLKKKLFPETK
jgi:hypothetical protein